MYILIYSKGSCAAYEINVLRAIQIRKLTAESIVLPICHRKILYRWRCKSKIGGIEKKAVRLITLGV